MFDRLFSWYTIAYIFGVVGVNLGFSYVPMIYTGIGAFSPMAIVVGALFVLRDFAQRRSGHFVLVAMLVAVLISYLLADPSVAIASALAFAAAEVVDYLFYTFSNKTFGQRVLISSAFSTPIDTAVFLFGIGGFTFGTFALMFLSKMVAALIIYFRYRAAPASEPIVDADGTELEIDVSDFKWHEPVEAKTAYKS